MFSITCECGEVTCVHMYTTGGEPPSVDDYSLCLIKSGWRLGVTSEGLWCATCPACSIIPHPPEQKRHHSQNTR